ncbi:MAG: sensor histidine kinase [Candidatus Dactylopiibacterium sp.]|nr:sensor histidine kinase [Candidatus Dactylopiibacterium sp.]
MPRRLLGLLLLCCLLLPAAAHSFEAAGWTYALTPRDASLAQVQGPDGTRWQPLEADGMVNGGFSDRALWLRTRYTAGQPGLQVLELTNPPHDHVTLYILRDGAPPEIRRGGFRHPSDPQVLSSFHSLIFDFELAPGQDATLYLSVETTRPLFVWPRLKSFPDFFRVSAGERLALGIYCGLFVTLCLYSLMAWATTRDSNYFDCFLFLFFMGLLQGHLLGVSQELLLQGYPALHELLSTLLPALALAAFCRFARNYLNLADLAPGLHRLLTWCTAASLLLLPAYAAGGSALSLPLTDLVSLLFSGFGIAAGFITLRQGFRPARYYLLSQIPLVGGGLFYVGANFNVFPSSLATMFGFQIGAGLSAVMIALALAGKLRTLQKDQIQAQNDRLVAEQQLIEVLKESEFQLETRVQERTSQLEAALDLQRDQHEALERSNARLKALHEERGAFLQIAAHDLKNPTAAIISYADLLRERWNAWDDDKKLLRLGNIRSMAQLTFDIIRNLLDIDAIESGHYVLRPGPVDAVQVLRAVCEEFRERCDAKHLRLHLALEDAPLLYVDKIALHQILDNLVSNAIKYSPHGRNLYVSLETDAQQAHIHVRDEGPGISDDDQRLLFRKFTRLSARPTAGEHSTGLGLSIVKYMTEASGGRVRCASRLGEGAIFSVSLPLHEDPAARLPLTA